MFGNILTNVSVGLHKDEVKLRKLLGSSMNSKDQFAALEVTAGSFCIVSPCLNARGVHVYRFQPGRSGGDPEFDQRAGLFHSPGRRPQTWTPRALRQGETMQKNFPRAPGHKTDMPTVFRDVRFQGQSGKHLLALSFS